MNILITVVATYVFLAITLQATFLYKTGAYRLIVPCWRARPLVFLFDITRDMFNPFSIYRTIKTLSKKGHYIEDEDVQKILDLMSE